MLGKNIESKHIKCFNEVKLTLNIGKQRPAFSRHSLTRTRDIKRQDNGRLIDVHSQSWYTKLQPLKLKPLL